MQQTRLEIWNEMIINVVPEQNVNLIINKKLIQVSNHITCLEIIKTNDFKNKNEIIALCFDDTIIDLNSRLCDYLRTDVHKNYKIKPITFSDAQGKHIFWHSSAHILGYALENLYQALLLTGPPLNEGFYYDAMLPNKDDNTEMCFDSNAIETEMNKIILQNHDFERKHITIEQAKKLFSSNPYKLEILNSLNENEIITAYRCGNFIDLCRGPHLKSTSVVCIAHVLNISNTSDINIKRIKGITFPNIKLMTAFQHEQKRRENYTHQIIGQKQNLFFFSDYSPGSCFFLEHGTRMYNALTNVMRKFYYKKGFKEVITPNIYKAELFKKSGHYDNYKDNMYELNNNDKEEYFLKPMNCPGHCVIFSNQTRSHNELPIRFADFGVLHRNELSGALSGLTRVRKFCQDDAHIFCTRNQIKEEINNTIQFIREIYTLFGFTFNVELSTRPKKYKGSLELWNYAESVLKEILEESFTTSWKLNKGDGSFYGPKLDFHVQDKFCRNHQCATIQLDFVLPESFNLEYVDENNSAQRPVMIHRAIYGSVERFFALLIEHYEGVYPLWLSPRQVMIVPVSNKFESYCKEVYEKLREINIYVDIDLSDNTFSKKVAKASTLNEKYNYILIIGEKELTDKSVSVKTDKLKFKVKTDEFIRMISNELKVC